MHPATYLARKEPYSGEKLLVATACVIIEEDRFMSYTDKFKYLISLLEKRMDDEVDVNGRLEKISFLHVGRTTSRVT